MRRSILHVSRWHMSPRWGFRILGCPVLYKHVAPLGLNTSTLLRLCVKYSFHSCRLASIRGGIPLFTPHANMSPRWGFKTFGCPVLYKHAAPLGLNAPMNLFHLPAFLSSAVDLCGVPFFTYHASTCRPAGALGYLVVPFSINMSPRWG